MQWGIDDSQHLVCAHTCDACSYGKQLAYSGMFYDRRKIVSTVNTGKLLTTVLDESRLVPVQISIIHLPLEDKVTSEEVMMVSYP